MTKLALLLIFSGGAMMSLSIFKYRLVIEKAKKLIKDSSSKINCEHKIHQILMCFFLAGYIVVFISVALDIQIIGVLFTGIIFLFGAIFVFTGIKLQSDMLISIRQRHEEIITKNDRLLQTQNVTIFALAYQAEIRDKDTGKHLERTSNYVEILGKELSKTPKYQSYITQVYLTDLVRSAPLHDIGKVGVPDSILKKPGKLTPEEFEIIKKHCEHGANLLHASEKKLDFESFFRVAVKLVMSHHERWDGKGYPQGLKENEIPLSARIMALADVYDALRSERCYKKGLSHEEACIIIENDKGKQFDPDVTDAFLRAEKEFSQVSDAIVG